METISLPKVKLPLSTLAASIELLGYLSAMLGVVVAIASALDALWTVYLAMASIFSGLMLSAAGSALQWLYDIRNTLIGPSSASDASGEDDAFLG